MATTLQLSQQAAFDDICRCVQVLIEGTAEEEFLRALKLQDKYREECLASAQEAQRIQKELDASLQNMADLESKLFRARRLLEMESKARREAEHERDQMERKIVAVAELLQAERNLKEETKDKLAFLNTLPRKRKSAAKLDEQQKKNHNEINSTGSFLSDLSITQSDDDFLDLRSSRQWHKHRPSLPKNQVPCIGGKRSRLSGGCGNDGANSAHRSETRRSGTQQQYAADIAPGTERFCATTKVTIPQDGTGAIRAESTIESLPLVQSDRRGERPLDIAEIVGDGPAIHPTKPLSPFKEATAPPLTPVCKASTPLQTSETPNQQQQGLGRTTMLRKHNFTSKTFIRADTCAQCQKKIRFGAVALRCRDCSVRCHVDCRYLLTLSCVPQSATPTIKGAVMGSIVDYAPSIPPMIPALIVHCVNEIESRGLGEVGIYRVSGSERDVKGLKDRFLRGKTTPHLNNVDVHVLCGCIKDFLRSLREPLIPTSLWQDFCNPVQLANEQDIQSALKKAINALPPANRDTLAFLILHFQRIGECPEVRMPIDNIARVFGPTIVGYSTPDPDQQTVFAEVYTQYAVMLNLLKIPTAYWTQYVSVDAHAEEIEKENNFQMGLKLPRTPSNKKESLYSLYTTPLKSTTKKHKFFGTPPTRKK